MAFSFSSRRSRTVLVTAVAGALALTACAADGAVGASGADGANGANGADGAAVPASSSSSAAPVAGSGGIGDRYWPEDGNGGIDVRHYDIHDAYAFDTGRLSGHTTLSLEATQDLRSFHLDFLLPVTGVTVDGLAAEHDSRKHELVIRPARTLVKGSTVKVRVRYAGRPSSYSYAGESNWLASQREVVAMNQPHMATWWYPSNDHPRDKATFDITITGPAGHQVISNGLPVKRTRSGDQATTHWRSKYPMASYLAFFALGRFDVVKGKKNGLPYYVGVSKAISRFERATAKRVLTKTPGVTAWLASRLGRYPFESTGGLTTSLPVGFALENQTRPTYPTSFGSDLSVVVHEVAHQWFGDSVSVHRWRDIWLNEGFASFMEVVYAETHGGPSGRTWLRDQYGERRGDADFWRLDIADPGADHIFDGPVYTRGSMAAQALRNRIGGGDFWTLLRTWVKDHRYDDGTVEQFERLAHRVSGERLDGFFDAWLRAGTAPARTRANGLR